MTVGPECFNETLERGLRPHPADFNNLGVVPSQVLANPDYGQSQRSRHSLWHHW